MIILVRLILAGVGAWTLAQLAVAPLARLAAQIAQVRP